MVDLEINNILGMVNLAHNVSVGCLPGDSILVSCVLVLYVTLRICSMCSMSAIIMGCFGHL
jgi:tRNA(Arg) A34 adenosine deaminase TadA